MNNTKNILIILTIMVLSISTISAKSYSVTAPEATNSNRISINIIQQNQEQLTGRLINADESYFVFENVTDASIQVIPRDDVSILETNLDVNLYSVLKNKDSESLTDIIELNDGTKIASIILDISAESIQYFTGKSLKRQVISTETIYALHLNSDSVEIPFPMITATVAAL